MYCCCSGVGESSNELLDVTSTMSMWLTRVVYSGVPARYRVSGHARRCCLCRLWWVGLPRRYYAVTVRLMPYIGFRCDVRHIVMVDKRGVLWGACSKQLQYLAWQSRATHKGNPPEAHGGYKYDRKCVGCICCAAPTTTMPVWLTNVVHSRLPAATTRAQACSYYG
jgi:hypothetical protein